MWDKPGLVRRIRFWTVEGQSTMRRTPSELVFQKHLSFLLFQLAQRQYDDKSQITLSRAKALACDMHADDSVINYCFFE